MTRQTSKETYNNIKASGVLGKMQWQVYDLLYQAGEALTGAEVNARMGSYSGHKRLSELRNMGVVEEADTRPCQVTGRNAIAWQTTNSLPVEVKKPEKPALVVKIYKDGRTEVHGREVRVYDSARINQIQGVKKTGRGVVMNSRSAMQINLWRGMEDFSLDAKDLNTEA